MSTTESPQQTCKCCEESYEHGLQPGYCSLECYHKHKGENVLRQISNDHRFCSSCFRRQKSIEKPPEWFLKDRPYSIRESIVGFEYYTEHVSKDHGFSYCECGNVDHYATNKILQDIEPQVVIKNLGVLLAEYYNEGQLGSKPDFKTFTETLLESENHALAIGKAIYEH